MNKVYGSETELALRILMLLMVSGQAVNIDRMVSYDFMATYGAYFEVDDTNLHGDNEYSFGELSVRRKGMMRSIRYLVTQDLIRAEDTDDGFYYVITDRGKSVVNRLTSEYAQRYLQVMKDTVKRWGSMTDKGLRDLIDCNSRNK